jgi:hypothetical protein
MLFFDTAKCFGRTDAIQIKVFIKPKWQEIEVKRGFNYRIYIESPASFDMPDFGCDMRFQERLFTSVSGN